MQRYVSDSDRALNHASVIARLFSADFNLLSVCCLFIYRDIHWHKSDIYFFHRCIFNPQLWTRIFRDFLATFHRIKFYLQKQIKNPRKYSSKYLFRAIIFTHIYYLKIGVPRASYQAVSIINAVKLPNFESPPRQKY